MFGDEHIGNIGLKEIDQESHKAECFIEIGIEQFRGQGHGRRAMEKILFQAFSELKLETIKLDVLEFNVSAIKIYERLGFCKQESFIWHYDEFGIYWQVWRMMLRAKLWKKRQEAKGLMLIANRAL